MSRAVRRDRTAKTISKRTRDMADQGFGGDGQKLTGHRLAKRDGVGHCGNRGCAICGREREQKRLDKKRERAAGRKTEQPDA